MHPVDIGFAILAAALLISGIGRGLIAEVFRLAALVGGIAAACLYCRHVGRILTFLPVSSSVKVAISFLIVYIAAAAAVLLVGFLVKKAVHLAMMGWLDRLGGALVGLLKASVMAYFFVLTASAFPLGWVHVKMRGSHVYSVFTRLPSGLNAPLVAFVRGSVRGAMDLKTLRSIRQLPHSFENFKNKVDSVKVLKDSI